MGARKNEDRLDKQCSEAMKRIILAIRLMHETETVRTYKLTKDKFIYNMF